MGRMPVPRRHNAGMSDPVIDSGAAGIAPAVHLYQIAYSPATLAAVQPGFLALDNVANPRPDWYEYEPIRRFLLERPLDEQAFYGFFSPKFTAKTLLDAAAARAVVLQAAASGADVVLFSPQPDMGAFFLNVFEQGEACDAGLIDAYEAFLAHIGRPLALRSLTMDARHVVFSNYFVARPAFWREWLALNEALWAVCEGPPTPLQQALTQPTTYPGQAQRKVFLQERAASLLLTIQRDRWKTHAANPFAMAWSSWKLREHPMEAVMSDALKLASSLSGAAGPYREAYGALRNQLFPPAA